MSIFDGRKCRRQRVAGKPAAANPLSVHNRHTMLTTLQYNDFCLCFTTVLHTHTLSGSLQTQLIRFDAGAITFRGPTVGLTEPIVIIDTRQLFHSGPMPIIGFKCMTSSYGPRFQWASCGGDEFSVAIYPFVRLI